MLYFHAHDSLIENVYLSLYMRHLYLFVTGIHNIYVSQKDKKLRKKLPFDNE